MNHGSSPDGPKATLGSFTQAQLEDARRRGIEVMDYTYMHEFKPWSMADVRSCAQRLVDLTRADPTTVRDKVREDRELNRFVPTTGCRREAHDARLCAIAAGAGDGAQAVCARARVDTGELSWPTRSRRWRKWRWAPF